MKTSHVRNGQNLQTSVRHLLQSTGVTLPLKTITIPAHRGSRALHQSSTAKHQNTSTRILRQGSLTPISRFSHRSFSTTFQRHTPHSTLRSVSDSTTTTPPSPSANNPIIHPLFEPVTGTYQYLVADPSTLSAVIIDPVLNYDPTTRTISTTTASSLLSLISTSSYNITHILETHAHADHLTAAFYIQRRLTHSQGNKPPICIGKRITSVQQRFGAKYGIEASEYEGVFDRLLDDDEALEVGDGGLEVRVMHLPGHTPDHLGYRIGDNVFAGDSLFHPDIGTARCDFPGGNAHDLFHSAQRLLSLPDHVRIWTGHDYPPDEREEPVAYKTVGEHKRENRHVRNGVSEQDFVKLRKERDAILGEPRLLHQSLQVNVRGGRMPRLTEGGLRVLAVPVKVGGEQW